MVLHLAEELYIPMRERNVLLVAAGYAPIFAQRSLDDPALAAARSAIDLVLRAQRPYPAFAIDRHCNIVASNGALPELFAGVAAELLKPPMNALRLSLHPQGAAPRIANFREWRAQLDLVSVLALFAGLALLVGPLLFGREFSWPNGYWSRWPSVPCCSPPSRVWNSLSSGVAAHPSSTRHCWRTVPSYAG